MKYISIDTLQSTQAYSFYNFKDREEHDWGCTCVNCPIRCKSCGQELDDEEIDICDVCWVKENSQ